MPKRRRTRRARIAVGERDRAGQDLAHYILGMYALGQISAKAACEVCWHAWNSGSEGDLLEEVAQRPGQTCTGNYKRHLDSVVESRFPATADLQSISVPCWLKGARTTKQVPVAAAYDCLEAELRANPGAREVLRNTQWPSTYEQHRYRHLPGDTRDVYPLSLYADGVQCTKQKGAGKVDSMIGITVTNAATGKRHLLVVFSKRQCCKCGCHGWCTLFAFMRFVTHAVAAAAQGRRPSTNMNGAPWPSNSAAEEKAREQPLLDARFVVTEVKADWAEMCNTFGFSTWQTINRPCVFACRHTAVSTIALLSV